MAAWFDVGRVVTYTHSSGLNRLLSTAEWRVDPGPRTTVEEEVGMMAGGRVALLSSVPSVSRDTPWEAGREGVARGEAGQEAGTHHVKVRSSSSSSSKQQQQQLCF